MTKNLNAILITLGLFLFIPAYFATGSLFMALIPVGAAMGYSMFRDIMNDKEKNK